MWRAIKFLFWGGIFVALNAACLATLTLSIIYQKLPALDALEDYRPRLPMRIYTSNGDLIGEFGKEKRAYREFKEFPRELVEALLITEDARFFSHRGLDFAGIARRRAGLSGRPSRRRQYHHHASSAQFLSHPRTNFHAQNHRGHAGFGN